MATILDGSEKGPLALRHILAEDLQSPAVV